MTLAKRNLIVKHVILKMSHESMARSLRSPVQVDHQHRVLNAVDAQQSHHHPAQVVIREGIIFAILK